MYLNKKCFIYYYNYIFHIEHVVIIKIIKTVTVKSSNYCILQSGRTPLHEAALSWRSNKQVVETLIEAGVDVNATDKVSYYQATLCNSSYNNNVVDTYTICTYLHSYVAKEESFLDLALMTALSIMRE